MMKKTLLLLVLPLLLISSCSTMEITNIEFVENLGEVYSLDECSSIDFSIKLTTSTQHITISSNDLENYGVSVIGNTFQEVGRYTLEVTSNDLRITHSYLVIDPDLTFKTEDSFLEHADIQPAQTIFLDFPIFVNPLYITCDNLTLIGNGTIFKNKIISSSSELTLQNIRIERKFFEQIPPGEHDSDLLTVDKPNAILRIVDCSLMKSTNKSNLITRLIYSLGKVFVHNSSLTACFPYVEKYVPISADEYYSNVETLEMSLISASELYITNSYIATDGYAFLGKHVGILSVSNTIIDCSSVSLFSPYSPSISSSAIFNKCIIKNYLHLPVENQKVKFTDCLIFSIK